VKWGDEVHADVVATRLAIELGASYVDLKYWSGPGETLLILPPAKKAGEPSTQADLEKLLLNSPYKFHLRRYMLAAPSLVDSKGTPIGTGRVDAAMIERESLPSSALGCCSTKRPAPSIATWNSFRTWGLRLPGRFPPVVSRPCRRIACRTCFRRSL
jgi:hypothetical protein